jgi:shikimate dehydrogenase
LTTRPVDLRPDAAAWPTATTRLAGVLGHPVEHSLSPVLHNAAFAEIGLDWAYVAFDVPEGRCADAIAGARVLGLRGLSVTMPHKRAAAEACDDLSPTAAALGVANTIVRRGGRLLGEATDGPGFVASLRAAGHDPAGRNCVLLGAGGAASCVAHALGEAGAARVGVVARRPAAAEEVMALAGAAGSLACAADIASADFVVNATSVGMGGTPGEGAVPLGIDVDRLRPGQVVADLVYHPLRTPLLVAAEAAGATPVDGLGMLVHQAGLAFELWTGIAAPLGVMAAAARISLG